MKKLLFILCCCIWSQASCYEARVWTVAPGKYVKASYERMIFGRIQIRDEKKKQVQIPFDQLSKMDRQYIEMKVPPLFEINFRKKSRIRKLMEWTINGDRTTLYDCTVSLTKKSPLPSKAKLTVELYMVGEEVDGDHYILVQRDTSKFVFPEGKKSVYEYVVNEVPFRRYEASWAQQSSKFRGETYLGYMVVVLDSQGGLITYDTDMKTQNWLKEDVPGGIQKLRTLAIEGRGSVRSRHFDEKIRKARLPRIKWHKRTSFF